MDAMEAVNALAAELFRRGKSSEMETASATATNLVASRSFKIDYSASATESTRKVIERVSVDLAKIAKPSSTSLPTYTPSPANSDFILKRIAKSIGFKVAKALADSGAPDKHIASIISYLVSPFALLCMGMAIILNRTVVFATTRRPVPLPLMYRVILRSIAIYTLAVQTIPLFRALACSNEEFGRWILSKSRGESWLWGNLSRYLLDGNVNNSTIAPNSISSSLLYAMSPSQWSWWANEPTATKVVAESITDLPKVTWLICPGPEILWDLYRSICIGHFIETFTSVIQGRIPYSETGMTLFEYSVAFQEVQSSQQLSTEILVVSIISSLSQLAFHIQGMLNSYKYRLIPSSFFGVTFLSYFAYAVFNGRLLYFPSVCVIGYVPQLAVSFVVVVCVLIYGLACLFTGGSSNMQTSMQSIHIEMTEDFYTCLMKLGVIALTSATKATYLTEARSLCAPLATWIEFVDEGGFNKNSNNQGKLSSRNPYDIEVVGPPNENGYIRAQKVKSSKDLSPKELKTKNSLFTTVSRVESALRMVQALFTITFYMVWKGIALGLRKVIPKSSSALQREQSKTRAEEFEATLMAVRNNFIYAELNDEYQGGYLNLLNGEMLPEIDDSNDYESDYESEEEVGYEYESDYETEEEDNGSLDGKSEYLSVPKLRIPRNTSIAATTAAPQKSSINEFYDLVVSTPDYFLSLLAPKTSEQAEEVEILSRHLSTNTPGPLTRSRYHHSNQENDLKAILQVLRERRKPRQEEDDSTALRSTLCVVCQTSPRQVILWPCRCFALCEECRVALAFKHFKGCVCCRQEVDSFSRVYIP